jgi:C4-dicarboxylate transporter DctM subunit
VTEMGVITPPVGLNVYVIKGVAQDVPLETIFKGILPFLVAIVVAVIILMIFPQIATFLPGLALY